MKTSSFPCLFGFFLLLMQTGTLDAQTSGNGLRRFLEATPQVSIFSTTTDLDGNTYIAGVFADSIRISRTVYRSRGMLDIFIAKINPSGDVMWFKHAGGANLDYFKYIETDRDANVYVSALFRGRLVFEDTAIYSDGIARYFTVKYTPKGEMLWIRKNAPYR